MFFTVDLYTILKNTNDKVNETTSDIGKASHTALRLPVSDNRYATGMSTTSCLPTDTTSE